MDSYEDKYGMPGFSPTQGHIPSAIPFLIHARQMIMKGEIKTVCLWVKEACFRKMTDLSDGMSFIIENNSSKS